MGSGRGSGVEKPKEERVKEGISLLKQLAEAGVVNTAPGWEELKKQISDWVSTGVRWEGRIEFPSYGRYADVVLPRRAGQVAELAFKMRRVGR
jgi:hypothetical protein